MNLHLTGKTALVTGSTLGIGKAVAATLLKEGVRVIVNGRNAERLEATVNDLRQYGEVRGVAADLAHAAGADTLLEGLNGVAVDVLVNNVGFFEVKPFSDIPDGEWLSLFELNVMSGVRLSRALMPDMLDCGWGRIVFVASEQSLKPNPEMLHYATTKTAQLTVARGLAELTKGTGVTVNSVLAAPTWSEGVEVFLSKVAEAQGTTLEQVRQDYFASGDGQPSLLGRFADPQEIADVIVFLCSKNAAAINGAAQRVEGGIIRAIV